MASAPATPNALVYSGMYVTCQGRTCYVDSVENNLGYNQYKLIDIDSGVELVKARYEFEPMDDILKDTEVDMAVLEKILYENKEEIQEKRLQTVSTEELDSIALSRNSKRTKIQTNWAVKVFKGETLINDL